MFASHTLSTLVRARRKRFPDTGRSRNLLRAQTNSAEDSVSFVCGIFKHSTSVHTDLINVDF